MSTVHGVCQQVASTDALHHFHQLAQRDANSKSCAMTLYVIMLPKKFALLSVWIHLDGACQPSGSQSPSPLFCWHWERLWDLHHTVSFSASILYADSSLSLIKTTTVVPSANPMMWLVGMRSGSTVVGWQGVCSCQPWLSAASGAGVHIQQPQLLPPAVAGWLYWIQAEGDEEDPGLGVLPSRYVRMGWSVVDIEFFVNRAERGRKWIFRGTGWM